MSKMAELLIEIEDLLKQNVDVDTIATVTGVPAGWVIELDKELMGLHEYGYD